MVEKKKIDFLGSTAFGEITHLELMMLIKEDVLKERRRQSRTIRDDCLQV
jgi:hypothetical protein